MQVLSFFESLPPGVVGIKVYGTSRHWGREIVELRHSIRIIPPAYVKLNVKRGKSDASYESVTRLKMQFAAVKSPEQQAVLALHLFRDLIVRQRTQIVNALRGASAIIASIGDGHQFSNGRAFVG